MFVNHIGLIQPPCLLVKFAATNLQLRNAFDFLLRLALRAPSIWVQAIVGMSRREDGFFRLRRCGVQLTDETHGETVSNRFWREMPQSLPTIPIAEENGGADHTRLVKQEIPRRGRAAGLLGLALWPEDYLGRHDAS